jgi:hypothetical protein
MEEDKHQRRGQHQITPYNPQERGLFPRIPPGFKNFSKSVSIQTTRKPDGVRNFLKSFVLLKDQI